MIKLLLIALGGGLGASARFLINESMRSYYFFMLPSGIIFVNFLGCFLIGIMMAQITDLKSNLYFFIVVGFLGSFTTMSAFSQQTIEMLYNGKEINALIYILYFCWLMFIGNHLGIFIF
jgi:CrcB protein